MKMSSTEVRASPRTPRAWLPPRWFVRFFWFAHRRVYRVTRGRVGLWRPKPDGWGAMWLRTIGRRTGQERAVVVGYLRPPGPTARRAAARYSPVRWARRGMTSWAISSIERFQAAWSSM
jgi:hypothetical protein